MLCKGSLGGRLDDVRETISSPGANVTRGEFQVDAYPLYAASSLAANALARCSFAAGESSHTGWADGRAAIKSSQPASRPFQPTPLPAQLGSSSMNTPPNEPPIRPGKTWPSPYRVVDATCEAAQMFIRP
jgi:hypothetical protein